MRLLLVEDDALLAESLAKELEQAGYRVDLAATARDARAIGEQEPCQVAVLDLGLPDGSGFDVLAHWRDRRKQFPVMILTARGNWRDKVTGLKMGADDYLTKPFRTEELVARLQAILRRSEGRVESVLRAGRHALDEDRQSLRGPDGEEHLLTGTEFRLLRCLMSRPGQLFSKEQLVEQLYSLDDSPNWNTIEAYIRRLRKIVGSEAIVTRRGQGYYFNEDTGNQ